MAKTKKKKIDSVQFIAGTIVISFLIISLIFILGYIYLLIKEPIGFAIYINQNQIPQGTTAILTYKVSNYGFTKIHNISVQTEVLDSSSQKKIEDFEDMGFLSKESGSYLIKSDILQKKEYIILSNLTYIDSAGLEKSKPLTLRFSII